MKQHRLIAEFGLLFILLVSQAEAQSWPARPLRVIVPFAAGTITDIVPRLVFEQLSAQLGRAIVVENRPGAGGTTGAGFVAVAEPDGYTLLANSSAHTIAPALYPVLSYDPSRDFAAVAALANSPSVLVVSSASGFRNVGDLVAAAKAKPGGLNFASAGIGSATYLSAMRFEASAGITAVHVPFKGGPEALNELIAGRVDFFFAPVGVALPFVRDGKLTALVVNSTKRAAALPEVPTASEAGFANAEYSFWIGVFLPAKTPREIVERLHGEMVKALEAPKVRDRLAVLGVDPMDMAPREFDEFVARQIATDAELVRAVGLTAQ